MGDVSFEKADMTAEYLEHLARVAGARLNGFLNSMVHRYHTQGIDSFTESMFNSLLPYAYAYSQVKDAGEPTETPGRIVHLNLRLIYTSARMSTYGTLYKRLFVDTSGYLYSSRSSLRTLTAGYKSDPIDPGWAGFSPSHPPKLSYLIQAQVKTIEEDWNVRLPATILHQMKPIPR